MNSEQLLIESYSRADTNLKTERALDSFVWRVIDDVMVSHPNRSIHCLFEKTSALFVCNIEKKKHAKTSSKLVLVETISVYATWFRSHSESVPTHQIYLLTNVAHTRISATLLQLRLKIRVRNVGNVCGGDLAIATTILLYRFILCKSLYDDTRN